MIEQNMKSFRKEILEIKNRTTAGLLLDYDDALEEVRKELKNIFQKNLDLKGNHFSEKIHTKEDLRIKKSMFKEYIHDILQFQNIRVKGYEQDIDKLTNSLTSAFVGFDVLEDAFDNPKVTDIYIIDYDKIYIEEGGVNKRYQHTFRSKKHFKDFLFRLLNEAGKELNNGDAKKADFELYGDRYCATSPSISPEGFSLTIRKHAEDHLSFKDLLDQEVFSGEIGEFIGQLIKGERNIIYAGITGSGKTTSIRAILDEFVPALNKRMLICEDTQELFPKSDHTLQLVSSLTGDKKTEMTLQQLIYTALRLKPKYIVVGEIRAEEAQAASEAMETGHSTIFTMHGGKAINCINRIVTKYLMAMPTLGIDVVERIIGSSVDYICVQDNIPGIGRKITEISEIDYDFSNRIVSVKPIYKYDIKVQEFVRLNPISEEKVELMMRRGVQYEDIKHWLQIPVVK